MAAPHYVIRKSGDQFVPELQEAPGTCAMWTSAGGALALYGLMKRGVCGTLMLATGAALMYRGVTGHNPLNRVMAALAGWDHAPRGRREDSPSYQHDFEGRSNQLPADEVDEAAMESFPASDPPGRTAATSSLPK